MSQYIDDKKAMSGESDMNLTVGSSPQPKHFGPKFLIAIIAIAIVAGGAYAGIWWWGNKSSEVATTSTTPDPTADWKTYTNTQYGFEFKYPSNWKVPEESGNIFLGCAEIKMGGASGCPLSIAVYPASTPEKFLSDNLTGADENNAKRSPIRYVEINGVNVVEFEITSDYPGGHAYKVFLGDKFYVAFTDYLNSYKQDPQYDQILSTFKFLK